jgi:hypothetical protein
VTGAWLTGVGAALVGWAGDGGAPARAAAAVGAALWLCATVGVLLERDEPAFLRAWLPRGGWPHFWARLFVLVSWLQACIWPAVAVVAIRHGAAGAGLVLSAGLAIAPVAAVMAIGCGRLRERGLYLWGPIAAVCAALVAASLVGEPS